MGNETLSPEELVVHEVKGMSDEDVENWMDPKYLKEEWKKPLNLTYYCVFRKTVLAVLNEPKL